MILCDAGPLVAIIDSDDPIHQKCTSTLDETLGETLYSTWPCFTEAMHLLHRADGHRAQEWLWKLVDNAALALHSTHPDEWRRMRHLMGRYADSPMDLADASRGGAADQTGASRIVAIDRHFRAYRIHDKESFDIVPA